MGSIRHLIERIGEYYRNLPLQAKYVAPVFVTLAVVVISIYIYFPERYQQTLLRAHAREARRTAELFSILVADGLEQHSFDRLQMTLLNARYDPNISSIHLYDENGDSLVAFNPLPLPPLTSPIQKDSLAEIYHSGNVLVVRYPILSTEGKPLGLLLLQYHLESLRQSILEFRIATILFTLIAFALGFVFIQEITRRVTASISRLHQQMQKTITEGVYSKRVEVHSRDEVGELARTFNQMMSELESRHQRLVESQERLQKLNRKLKKLNKELQELNRLKTIFVSDASHALRTPLTIIRGEIEVALQRSRSPEEYARVLKIVAEEAARVTRIVENLLTLAKADTGNLLMEKEIVDLTRLCREQAQQAESLAEMKGVQFTYELAPNCYVNGDPNRLAETIFTLLENAIKYTPKGNSVTLSLKNHRNDAIIRVSDTGIGIPKEELPKIFQRFYRASNSRKIASGTGLGLAICESIIKAHGGEIRVESELYQGTTFEVRLRRLVVETPRMVPDSG